MQEMSFRKSPVLLVEALAARNDSGLGNMVRLYVDGLRGLADRARIKVVLPDDCAYRPDFPCEILSVRPRPLRLWIQLAFPMLIRKHAPDAVFCIGQNLPAWRPAARYALAIPDAGPLEDLGWATSSHDPYNRRWLKRMAPKADAIVTLSDFTKGRLSALLGIPGEKINVVRPIRPAHLQGLALPANASLAPHHEARSNKALDHQAHNHFGTAAPAPGRHPAGDYFLSLGNLEPRKNFPGLIAAYAVLKRRRPDAPPLYIAGHKAWGHAEVAMAITRLGVADSVHLTGYLSDADRAAHLAHCLAFISSSRYEGWGLPLFEALAQGRPSAYHAGSSQEEFARGMALAVDCGNPAALARAMERLWIDAGERARLTEALRSGFAEKQAYDLEGALTAALSPLLPG